LSNLAWPLSPPRHSHTSVVHNGYLYVVGGDDGGGPLDTVEYAPIIGDLLSDVWTYATPLPGPRAGHASFVYNGHLYVLGGTSASGVYEDDVFYAKINDDGSLGSWSSTTPLKSAREGLAAVNFGVSVYVLGGLGASTRLNDAWYAQFQ
jgi:N-acetylneuraminic acid mutarotase